MWSIGDVKRAAKEKLRNYYGASLLVVLIWELLHLLSSSGSSGNSGSGSGSEAYSWLLAQNQYLAAAGAVMIGVLAVAIAAAGILFSIFILNPVEVGFTRYFAESRIRDESAGVGRIFWAFSCGHYLNVVKIMFLRDLYTVLWSLLLVIPGLVKSYEYFMIPFILSENPEADARDVFALTKDMMTGSRMQMLLLQLSFMGWVLLGVLGFGFAVRMLLPFGLGFTTLGSLLIGQLSLFFIHPYMQASSTEVYYSLRGGIAGFPFNGFGVPEPETVNWHQTDREEGDESGAGSASTDEY